MWCALPSASICLNVARPTSGVGASAGDIVEDEVDPMSVSTFPGARNDTISASDAE